MKLALAPMATLSHEALRVLIHRWGDPDEYFSEMIHAPSFVAGGRFEPWYVRSAPRPERMVWQLTGSDVEPMARAAAMLAPHGGIGVDLNMGCSAPDIARSGAGIAWMSKPLDEVARLVSLVRAAIDRAATEAGAGAYGRGSSPRLGVKLRLGEREDYERLLAFCEILVESGCEVVTLHPRVRRDKYGRPARRSYVARLARDLSVPVYGNGDIASAADALAFAREAPCSGLMVGRAAVQKPWLFGEIGAAFDSGEGTAGDGIPNGGDTSVGVGTSARGDTRADGGDALSPDSSLAKGSIDHLEVAAYFLDALARSQPGEFLISRARRFFFYYCDNLSFAHHVKMKIQNAEKTADIIPILAEYFDRVPRDRYCEPRDRYCEP